MTEVPEWVIKYLDSEAYSVKTNKTLSRYLIFLGVPWAEAHEYVRIWLKEYRKVEPRKWYGHSGVKRMQDD